jgi:hypothetical protein
MSNIAWVATRLGSKLVEKLSKRVQPIRVTQQSTSTTPPVLNPNNLVPRTNSITFCNLPLQKKPIKVSKAPFPPTTNLPKFHNPTSSHTFRFLSSTSTPTRSPSFVSSKWMLPIAASVSLSVSVYSLPFYSNQMKGNRCAVSFAEENRVKSIW